MRTTDTESALGLPETADCGAFVRPGVRMDGAAFERFLGKLGNATHLEWVRGVVCDRVAEPAFEHGSEEVLAAVWLADYADLHASRFDVVTNLHVKLPSGDIVVPDCILAFKPGPSAPLRHGSAFSEGVPQLVLEVARSSETRDLSLKKDLYLAAGVPDYLVLTPSGPRWFVLTSGNYTELSPDSSGLLESPHLPGLVLDTEALARRDRRALRAAVRGA